MLYIHHNIFSTADINNKVYLPHKFALKAPILTKACTKINFIVFHYFNLFSQVMAANVNRIT